MKKEGIGDIMENYVINGKVVTITLDDGREVKASTEYLENMVKNLNIDMEEAVLTWLEDEEYLINEEQEELNKATKGTRVGNVIGAKAEKPKTQKERVKKENPTKEMIIAEIAKVLPNFAENVVVENAGKLITFTIGEDMFKIDLVQKRKPKTK
jgi:hypothetical protein